MRLLMKPPDIGSCAAENHISPKLSGVHCETQQETTIVHAIKNVPESKINDADKFLTAKADKQRCRQRIRNRWLSPLYILINRNIS